MTVTPSSGTPSRLEHAQRALQKPIGDQVVEAADHDADPEIRAIHTSSDFLHVRFSQAPVYYDLQSVVALATVCEAFGIICP